MIGGTDDAMGRLSQASSKMGALVTSSGSTMAPRWQGSLEGDRGRLGDSGRKRSIYSSRAEAEVRGCVSALCPVTESELHCSD